MYFLNVDSLTVTERYMTNGHSVENPIGRILSSEGRVRYRQEATESFLRRRSDFGGVPLKAMIEPDVPYLTFDRGVKKEETGWVEDRRGHPIKLLDRSGVSGLFFDVLRVLEKDMNFTTELYTRKDGAWGYPVNDTWVGMIANVIDGDAEFILGSLTINQLRIQVVNYLHTLTKTTGAIYISHKGLEEHAWLSFLYPFRTEVWTCLFFHAVLLLAAVKCLQMLSRGKRSFWSGRRPLRNKFHKASVTATTVPIR